MEERCVLKPLQAILKDDSAKYEQTNDIKANRTFSTFGFAQHKSQHFAKPKELNFATAPTDNKK